MYAWHLRFIIIAECVVVGIVVLNTKRFLDVCIHIHMYFSNANKW